MTLLFSVGRINVSKSYSHFIFFGSNLQPDYGRSQKSVSRGAEDIRSKAEIIPVEPGQGNACAGKVVE
jgi:hypothetical protein